MQTRAAAAVLFAMSSVAPGTAAAEGERTPMVGGALTYTDAPDHDVELIGGQVELAWWWGRLGLAVEGAANRAIEADSPKNLAVAGSARVLVADWLWPSLFEPRDVELGVELQAIAERTWWGRDDASGALGFGVAVRMRGGSDWEFSSLLAESRLFVRVMTSRDDPVELTARATDPMTDPMTGPMTGPMTRPTGRRGMTILVGLGAAFGAGSPGYLQRFRLKTFGAAP